MEDEAAVAVTGRELEAHGYSLLHPLRTKPWGRTVVRPLTGEGVIVGVSYAPWLRTESTA